MKCVPLVQKENRQKGRELEVVLSWPASEPCGLRGGFQKLDRLPKTSTRHRGPLLIHASQRRARRALAEIASEHELTITDELAALCARTGGILGMVDVVDCVSISTSRWFDGPLDSRGKRNWGYILRDARASLFRPALGRLGIFNLLA